MSFIQDTRLEVRPLTIEDAPACDQIILSLPHHFGYESGRAACAQEVRTSKGRVATLDGHVVGFLTVQDYFDTTAEITWMAVHDRAAGYPHDSSGGKAARTGTLQELEQNTVLMNLVHS